MRSLALVAALLLVVPRVAAAQETAQAGAPLACPRCGHTGTGKFCSEDGTPLVRSDLIVFHRTLSLLATGESRDGFANPFKGLVQSDGSLDIDKLEALVRDYKAAAKKTVFGAYTGAMPLTPPRAARPVEP